MAKFTAGVEKLQSAVLESAGATAPALRRAIAARVAAAAGAERADLGAEVPAEIARYIDQVGRDAVAVTAADLDGLKASGLSEDALFEITIAAALGAGLASYERGLAALEEAGKCD